MNDLETLKNLLGAAGLQRDKEAFTSGSIEWKPEPESDLKTVMAELKRFTESGASGWILFADTCAEMEGQWRDKWDEEYPIEGELSTGEKFLRLTYRNDSWTLSRAEVDPNKEGILETLIIRRHGGGKINYLAAWTGEKTLRPTSAALLNVTTKN